MMLLYLRFEGFTWILFVIYERSGSFQHSDCAKEFMEEESTKTVNKHVVEWAFDLPEAIDTGVRLCAEQYVEDFEIVFLSEKICNNSAPSQLEALQRFVVSPKRNFLMHLDNFREAVVAAIQNAVKPLKLILGHVVIYDLRHILKKELNDVENANKVPLGPNLFGGVSTMV